MASHRRRPVSLPAASMLGLVVIAVISIHAAAWAEPGRPPVDPATLPALPIAADDDTPWTVEEPFPFLRFVEPVYLCQAPHDDRWFYVLERTGAIRRFRNDPEAVRSELFLDLNAVTEAGRGQDNGLLGLAFHPQFGQDDSPNRRYFYVYYITRIGGTTYYRLSRFEAVESDAGDLVGDRFSETILVQQHNRDHLHNGGALHFGPDGFLYWSVGDEGGQGDPFESGQRINDNLFSGVFRIDVDKRGGEISHPPLNQPTRGQTAGYYIPSDNPFVGGTPRGIPGVDGALEEYWALGFRSPHRMSFDAHTGDLWLGDVGHNEWEGIHRVTRGSNHGWSYREGFVTYARSYLEGVPPDPYPGRQTWPVYAYPHTHGDGCVIGGYVYRGASMPELQGWYVFGDLVSGRVRALKVDQDGNAIDLKLLVQLPDRGRRGLSSFGVDHAGELYLCILGQADEPDGRILRLTRSHAGELARGRERSSNDE